MSFRTGETIVKCVLGNEVWAQSIGKIQTTVAISLGL